MLRGGWRPRDVHPEDPVIVRVGRVGRIGRARRGRVRTTFEAAALLLSGAAAAFACGGSTRAPLGAGDAPPDERVRPDAATAGLDEIEEEADRRAATAGLSERALPCASDNECLTHRCDVSLRRCRFPCRSDADCQAGAACALDAGALAACFTKMAR